MEKYERAEMEVVEFEVEDIITTSGDVSVDPNDDSTWNFFPRG